MNKNPYAKLYTTHIRKAAKALDWVYQHKDYVKMLIKENKLGRSETSILRQVLDNYLLNIEHLYHLEDIVEQLKVKQLKKD